MRVEDADGFGQVDEPVGAGHGYRGGWEKEEFVGWVEDGHIGVEGEDAGVGCLVEGEEFGERVRPDSWEVG